MTQPGMNESCSFSRWTESFLDGELSPEHTVDFENHLPGCGLCNTKLRFERAVRISTQRAIRVTSCPSMDFEARLRAVMAVERTRESQAVTTPLPFASQVVSQLVPVSSQPARATQHRPLSWRAIAPLSVAAAAALAFAALRGEPTQGSQVLASATGGTDSRTDTMQTVRDFLDQLAADSEHTQDVSSELYPLRSPYRVQSNWPGSMNGMLVNATESINVINGQKITPPHLDNAGAIWEGYHFRQVPVQGRVSSWHYRMANHRVLLWVYDSTKLPLRAVLEPRVANNQAVFVGMHHGRAVAALEKNGFGYAATTDLPQAQAAELVAALGNTVVR